jgi:diguanylate cyclase
MVVLAGISTSLLFMVIAVAGTHLTLGLGVGWWFRGRRLNANSDLQARRTGDALQKIQELAAGITRDVGEHTQRVGEISQAVTAAEALGDGPLGEAIAAAMAQFVEVNAQLQNKLQTAESKLQEQTTKIQHHIAEARTDALTGLANRRAFDDELQRRFAEYERHKTPVSLLLVDVDHFKKFNDTHGHQAGDEVLRGVARVLFESMREVDLVARYGGEEFAVVFPSTTAEEARQTVELTRMAIASVTFKSGQTDLRVTVSGGLTEIRPGDTIPALIQRADEALYASKTAGRNRCHLHTGDACIPLSQDESAEAKSDTAAIEPSSKMSAAKDVKKATSSMEPAKTAAETRLAASPKPVPLAASSTSSQFSAADPPPDFATENSPLAASLEYRNQTHVIAPQNDGSRTDPVTGLRNRQAFSEDLRRRVAEWQRFSTPTSLMLVEIDGLRRLSQTLGQETGNTLLRAATQFLITAMREMDLVARYEGAQFVLILPGTELINAVQAAERIRNAVAFCTLRMGANALNFTISAGVAEAMPGDDMDTLLNRTAAALGASIDAGGNCTFFHDGMFRQHASALLEVVAPA